MRFQCVSSCASELFAFYDARHAGMQRPSLPLCPRFLNSGGVIGYAEDMLKLYEEWAIPASQWSPRANGPSLTREQLGPASCANDDQCLAHYLFRRSNGTIALDASERIFASAATAVNASESHEDSSFKWPVEGSQHCGSDVCRASRKLLWRRSFALPADGRLVRSEIGTCGLHEAGPMTIHFNGPLKGDWKSADTITNWLVEHILERQHE